MERTQKVDLFYDLVDEACMLLHEQLHLNYVEAFLRVSRDITDEVDESRLSEEAIEKLHAIYDKLNGIYFVNEDIRLAIVLLVMKGLKHVDYSLEGFVPDSVAFLFAFIIERMFDREFSMMNIQMGIGNLLYAIANFVTKEVRLLGIEEDEMLVNIASASANLQNTETKIFFNKPLDPNLELVDCLVGNLENKFVDEKYLPYELILHHLDNLSDDGIFLYVINNDFFHQNGIKEFKEKFNGSFRGLLVLPSSMFSSAHQGKSILIGSRKPSNEQLVVMNFPSLSDQEKVKQSISELEKWIDKMKGTNE